MSLETQLRNVLAARADELRGPAFDPYERVAGAVVTSRRRRRAAAVGAIAAVAVAAVIAVVVPSLGQGGDRATLPAQRTRLVVPGPDDPRWSSLSTWPTRGSLATDSAFLASVGNHFATSHVLYAADLPTSRVVVSWDPESGTDGKLTMFAGRRGGSAQDLSEVSSASGGLDDLVSLPEHADNDSTLVVLGRPSVPGAGISRSVQIGLDGSVAREAFRPVKLIGGVYSELLEDSPGFLTRVRDGDRPGSRVTLTGRQSLNTDDRGAICLSCTGEDFRVKAEKAMGGGVAVNLGLNPEEVRTSTVYFGPVDRAVARQIGMPDAEAAGATAQLMVTDSTLPQGQVLRSALLAINGKDGSGSTTELANGVPIDASTARMRPFVLGARGLGEGTSSAQVFAAEGARVRLVSDAPTIYPTSKQVPLVHGSATFSSKSWAGGLTAMHVATYDISGREVGRWPIELPSEDVWTEGTQR